MAESAGGANGYGWRAGRRRGTSHTESCGTPRTVTAKVRPHGGDCERVVHGRTRTSQRQRIPEAPHSTRASASAATASTLDSTAIVYSSDSRSAVAINTVSAVPLRVRAMRSCSLATIRAYSFSLAFTVDTGSVCIVRKIVPWKEIRKRCTQCHCVTSGYQEFSPKEPTDMNPVRGRKRPNRWKLARRVDSINPFSRPTRSGTFHRTPHDCEPGRKPHPLNSSRLDPTATIRSQTRGFRCRIDR